MKKSIALLVVLFSTLTFVFAQNPPASPRITAESPSKNIVVKYGQPSKKGRVIFGDASSPALEKYGKVWRTGANEATEITFTNDVMLGGKMVKAGTYTLFTIPGEKEWSVILNSTLGQWGAYEYDKIKGADVAKIMVPAAKTPAPVEKMTITAADNSVTLSWDNVMVAIPVMQHGK
jgi:Protein of unknown function (DUF2911)